MGRQGQQGGVVWHAEATAGLTPPGLVEKQCRVGARADLAAGLPEVLVHCLCVGASVLAAGMTTAAPTSRAGQIAPNKQAEPRRLSRTMTGREPTGAQTWVSVPFWPARASSLNQISIGLPAAEAGTASVIKREGVF